MRVVVTTHDAYAHLVPVFIEYFQSAWPSCPYPMEFVGCTEMPEEAYDYDVVLLGEDKGWSSNMLDYLGDSTEPFLLLLEEFFVTGIDLNILEETVAAIEMPNVGQVRLKPCPGPTLDWSEDIGEIDKQEPYAISLQTALWKPQVFRDLLRHGENHYRAEQRGSRRARGYEKFTFLATWDWVVRYKEYYARGGRPYPETVAWLGAGCLL